MSAPGWTEPVPWPFITKIVESERFFFLYHAGSSEPEYVPKAAITDAEIHDLRDLLRNRLGSQTAQLKLYSSPREAASV
jgi:hypothetical protein